ncbi:hypothetical protein [Brevibacillus porteri]|uniref:hypothetical protein n=1 Tax=Brevibacillus porteri TaxID=2126350 RepID=UPI003D222051
MALKRLETHHMIAIKYLSQPRRGGKTMDEIATEASVSRQALYDWLKDPLFDKELKKEIIRETRLRVPDVLDSMADAAIHERNAQAAKIVLQVNDMLTEKVELEQKTTSTGTGDLEALKKEVEGLDQEDL